MMTYVELPYSIRTFTNPLFANSTSRGGVSYKARSRTSQIGLAPAHPTRDGTSLECTSGELVGQGSLPFFTTVPYMLENGLLHRK
jgi:hypothetical protein